MNATSPALTDELRDRIHACWLGKSIGGTLGLPAEGKMERLNFSFYDPVPTIAPPNDDLELQLVWLYLVEKSTTTLTQADFAKAWLDHIHYMWDEYGRCRWNLRRGVPAENVGTFENHFHDGMGSPIRSEIWACLFPGDADSAAHYAALDASLDHGTEGIAGEVFFAAMQSAVAAGESLNSAITLALAYLPTESETGTALKFILASHKQALPEWECWEQVLKRFGSENFTHAPLNVAITMWALLYGEGDFEKSILLATNAGYDTDCTAATAGATLGFLLGTKGIPSRWSSPIGEGVYLGPGILGIDAPSTLTELTDRTTALLGKLEPKPWDGSVWKTPTQAPSLESLPGSILLQPNDGSTPVSWANGELPAAVKLAGGASWKTTMTDDASRYIVCLARHGARLFLDGSLVLECPAGLPYVPATHRCPEGSRSRITLGQGDHDWRLELYASEANQEATLILAYPNFHICPWSAEELPFPATLPDA